MIDIVVNYGSAWRFRCPKCGNSCECEGEEAHYNGYAAELIEWHNCPECGTYFEVVSEMTYKYHTIGK